MNKNKLLSVINDKQKKYDYSLVVDTFSYNETIPCVCRTKDSLGREHGIFNTTYGHLLRGDGCPKCNGKYMDNELFVHESMLIHGDKYSYDNSIFSGKRKKINIFCKKHKLYFQQTPEKHLLGHGCPKCRYDKSSSSKTKTLQDFIECSIATHGNKYDTSRAIYNGSKEKLTLICHEKDDNGVEHGEFEITPNNHLNKSNPQGCPKCGRISSISNRIKSFDEFENEANSVHNGKYKYVKNTYVNASNIIDIICPTHGLFHQKGTNHTCLRQGCPKCSNQMSSGEDEIYSYLCQILPNCKIERRNRALITPMELDIVVPSRRIAIEFNGLVWHSDKFGKDKSYHIIKTKECDKLGIRLIHIFEDEWNYKRKQIKSMLLELLGHNINNINGDSCIIKEIDTAVARNFIDGNSIDRYKKSKYKYGLYTNDNELVSVITFGNYSKKENSYEIISFVNKLNTVIVNELKNLIHHFVEKHRPSIIKVSIDRRFCYGIQYKELGFNHVSYTKPRKFYINGKYRTKKKIDNTAKQYKIYDCGTDEMELIIV